MTWALRAVATVMLLAGWIVGSTSEPVSAQVGPTITDLGALGATCVGGCFGGAMALDDAGRVVGQASTPTGLRHAFLRQLPAGARDLSVLGGPLCTGCVSTAFAVNAGLAVGQSESLEGGAHAVRWTLDGSIQDLGSFASPTCTACTSVARAINGSVQIAGQGETALGGTHAFRWDRGGFADLGTLGAAGCSPHTCSSDAYGINDGGVIVGESTFGKPNQSVDTTHAFVWSGATGMRDIGTLGGGGCSACVSAARAVNATGQVVGRSDVVGNGPSHAFLWQANGGFTDLGTLGSSTEAHAINAAGVVVGSGGSRAFVWRPDSGIQDLSSLLPPGSDWLLTDARGINASGAIVGIGTHQGSTRGFLLVGLAGGTPSPSPTAAVTLTPAPMTSLVSQTPVPSSPRPAPTSADLASRPLPSISSPATSPPLPLAGDGSAAATAGDVAQPANPVSLLLLPGPSPSSEPILLLPGYAPTIATSSSAEADGAGAGAADQSMVPAAASADPVGLTLQTSDDAAVWDGPYDEAGRIGLLPVGSLVLVVQQVNGRILVQFGDGSLGWLDLGVLLGAPNDGAIERVGP